MTSLGYSRQSISVDDIAAVVRVLQSDLITQGPMVPAFEEAVAARCGARHAIAVSSGTAALHLGALALGLGPGKMLWTSPNSFVASANCARFCGAAVDFVDIEAADGNMSVVALEAKLAAASRTGTLPDVVVPVHFGGQPCDMDRIAALAREYGFRVMEDASHAVGASYAGSPVGGLGSDLVVFSFHPVKIVTTGEGGMVLTDSDDLKDRIERLRSHGISRSSVIVGEAADPWVYAQVDLGYNYRVTDIQAALGVSQLGRLDEFVARRNRLARRYDAAFASSSLTPLAQRSDRVSSYHLYVARLARPAWRRRLFDMLNADGIIPQVHYIPIHTQPYYRDLGFQIGDFPAAEYHYAHSISLPLFPAMTDDDQDRVIEKTLASLRKIEVEG